MPLPIRTIHRFSRDEDGAVTVDWVALTAGILLLGMVTGFTVSSSVPTLANKMSSFLSNTKVGDE
ncbi:hypothetical protein GQE99_06770 [Maritimibacter sp. DP07]|uniref:Flp pilus assembly protein, pilin Flp n=1 Tax=Maritimibacter harenae TaxID=2606218 RepID=A0A845M8S4_9RHOB|nr:hypothetical protein [Maritimibacter harenae]MZR12721.1 hypothetical protein [Maritimibacter harenae]